jgi:hypothetical protein
VGTRPGSGIPLPHPPIENLADGTEIRALSAVSAARYDKHMANGTNGDALIVRVATSRTAASSSPIWAQPFICTSGAKA